MLLLISIRALAEAGDSFICKKANKLKAFM